MPGYRAVQIRPPLGEYQAVAGPGDWAEFSAAHEASELAAADERGGA